MKPWVIVAGDFVRTGGMDAANHALAGFLARSGRETHLVAHRIDPQLAGTPGIRSHLVPRPFASHLLGFPLLEGAGRRLTRRTGGIALANGGNFPAPATWLHYVHAAHRPELAGRGWRRAAQHLAHRRALAGERRVASAARVVIANSALTSRQAVERLGAEAERVHTVYYGTDPEHFRPPSPEERAGARLALGVQGQAPALAFVGALGDRRKGFDTLFTAFTRLAADSGWDASLLVAGAGAELEAWERRTRAAGLASRIRFLGFRQEVREVLFAADAVVAPSRYEAYGLAVQEAICVGLPAVVSRAAGIAERIPAPLDGLLLDEPDDADALGRRLLEWREGMERYRSAALELSASLRSWSWDHMAARIVDLVERDGRP
jgi:glycosyltransferase involved in cell wall biosynthesis